MMKETSSLMTTDYLFKVKNLENYFLIQYKRYLLNASLDFGQVCSHSKLYTLMFLTLVLKFCNDELPHSMGQHLCSNYNQSEMAFRP